MIILFFDYSVFIQLIDNFSSQNCLNTTMKPLQYALFVLWVTLWSTVLAFTISDHNNDHSGDSNSLILDNFSLPDMIKLIDLPSDWQLRNDAVLQDGRIILTPKAKNKGQLWLPTLTVNGLLKNDKSHNVHSNNDGAFTIEWVFRSINFNDISSSSLNFYMILDDNFDANDNSLANGPNKFNGLSLIVKNSGKFADSISAIINNMDHRVTLDSVDQMAFTQCLLNYQESAVPITLRLSYNPSDNHLLKLQVDNKVCFQTRKIKFWDPLNADQLQRKIKFGVTADNVETTENFEILRVKLFNGLSDATQIPNVKQLPQPIIITKFVDQDTGEESTEMKDQFALKNKDLNNYQLWKKLDLIEGKLLSNDINLMIDKLDKLNQYQNTLLEYLVELSNGLIHDLKKNDKARNDGEPDSISEFKSFTKINDKLSQLLVEQEKIRDLHKKTNKSKDSNHYSPHQVVKFLLLWITPFLLLLFIMGYHTFKIKQELSNIKLL